jgi:hypothetical protein
MSKSDTTVRHWRGEVSKAAAAYEARWTDLSLRRVDSDLAQRLFEQRGLFDEACVIGTVDDIETQGSAMCRGYAAAVKAMEQVGHVDDAYMLGSDPTTGLKVAVGMSKASIPRVTELHGQDVVWVTPDEVAALMASVEAFRFAHAVKQKWPAAEMVRRYAEAGS